VAASLYGVGARLDSNPELLFVLRGVDPADLINKASAAEAVRQTAPKADGVPAMTDAELSDVFGIELQSGPVAPATLADTVLAPMESPRKAEAGKEAPALPQSRAGRPRRKPVRKMSAAARARMAALVKARWRRHKEALSKAPVQALAAAAAKANPPRLRPSSP
jgi:hypothetical protein